MTIETQVDHHEATVLCAHREFVNKSDRSSNRLSLDVISKLINSDRRCVELVRMNHFPGWLTMILVGQNYYDLTKQVF